MELRGYAHRISHKPTTKSALIQSQVKANFIVGNHCVIPLYCDLWAMRKASFSRKQLKRLLLARSGEYTTIYTLLDNACSFSHMSKRLENRLGYHSWKLNVEDINNEEIFHTKVIELTLKPCSNQSFELFEKSPQLKENLNVGADLIRTRPLLPEPHR